MNPEILSPSAWRQVLSDSPRAPGQSPESCARFMQARGMPCVAHTKHLALGTHLDCEALTVSPLIHGEDRTAGNLRPGAEATGAAGGTPTRHMYVMMYRIHRTTLRRQQRGSHAMVLHVHHSLSRQGQALLKVPQRYLYTT